MSSPRQNLRGEFSAADWPGAASRFTIIARARTEDSRSKLLRAGANRAVDPQLIAGGAWRVCVAASRGRVPRRRHARRDSRLQNRGNEHHARLAFGRSVFCRYCAWVCQLHRRGRPLKRRALQKTFDVRDKMRQARERLENGTAVKDSMDRPWQRQWAVVRDRGYMRSVALSGLRSV